MTKKLENLDSWQSLADAGEIEIKNRNYGEAEKYFSQALELVEREQFNSLERATVLDFLSLVHVIRHNYELAEGFAKKALAVKLADWQDLGDEDASFHWLDIATSETNLASIYLKMNQAPLATESLKSALECSESVLGKSSIGLTSALRNLAIALKSEGRLDEAFLIYKRLLKIQISQFDFDDPAIEDVLKDLSLLHSKGIAELAPLVNQDDPRVYKPLHFSHFIAANSNENAPH